MPIFSSQDLTQTHADYIPVAAVAHLGLDRAGHCIAAMKMQPGLTMDHQPAQWLLTEDGEPPKPSWQLPHNFAANIVVVWVIRTDCLNLPRVHKANMTQSSVQTETAEGILQLILAQQRVTHAHEGSDEDALPKE